MADIRLRPHSSGSTRNSSDSDINNDYPVSMETNEPELTDGLRRAKRQVRRGPRTVQSETKYVELLVVNDYELFVQMRRSAPQTRNFAKAVVNMADAIYKEQLNTRIVLVAMETWSTQNMVSVGDDPLLTLRDFMKYRKENIKEKSDAAHLLSAEAVALPILRGSAHQHEEEESMRYYLPRKFSRCSIEEYIQFLQQGGGSCLFNKPNKYEQRGVVCRDAVNDCDVPETCTGDSSKGRCYGGRCKTRDAQCLALWGHNAADRMCYEKLNTEGTERGNCGQDSSSHSWIQCNKQDVLCGFLLCTNITAKPRYGDLNGEITSLTIYHQNKYLDCRGGHAVLEDGTDLGYVEDGTPCGPNMMCLDHRCLAVTTFNLSSCPGSSASHVCSDHGTCSNEVKCICDTDYTGKDCSVYDPIPDPQPPDGPEKYKGPSGTNIIIGSIAGAILLAAIVLGGTGWGFK
ncbi:Disintegrin and metalloproteinase domain-containing protein 11 [Labeo rohita]|uniref:Disintegrin and metalloproteinase domain-containing protein 11 n=1 Tax=Labeo rohita TaxID=84645 RepID=A0ABQ8M7U4_LABRO|nr:Disintegrin and metalloproteinase domain-containing protein 11 [Labeo rohita]